jgi:transmembrane sensor
MKSDHFKKKHLFWDLWSSPVSRERNPEDVSLQSLRFKNKMASDPSISDAEIGGECLRLAEAIRQQPKVKVRTIPAWYQVAAALVAGLVLLGVIFWELRGYFRTEQITTAYGQTKTIWLPDSSRVTLNANSTLTYPTDWKQGDTREVSLLGEAFFQVRQYPTAAGMAKFVVHTEEMDVQVIGTSFNVINRGSRTQVVLEEGQVRVQLNDGSEVLHMQPGELVEVSRESDRVIHKSIDPHRYTAWIQNQLLLNNTSLKEIALTIEETYGVEVVMAEVSLSNLRLTGSFPLDNLDRLLEVLSASAGIEANRKGRKVVITEP